MQIEQQIKISVQKFFKSYGLDPVYGFLIPQNYNPKCFNKSQLMQALLGLHLKIKDNSIESAIRKIGKIELNIDDNQIDSYTKIRDCIYLHGFLSDLLHAFTNEKRNQGFADSQMIAPQNLAKALQIVCKFLGMKYGMCGEFYCNWKFKDKRQIFSDQIELKKLTRVFFFNQPQDQYNEDIFFCCSAVGSFYLFKSIKSLHVLNQIIQKQSLGIREYAVNVLNQVYQNITKLNSNILFLLNNFDGNFFTNKLRKYISGFENIRIEGSQQRMTSGGGAGGFDPCFQLFQRILGIKYQGKLAEAQQMFKTGFPNSFKNLINYYEKNSNLKRYFQINDLIKEYNRIVKEYSVFYVIHRQILYKFVAHDITAQIGKGGVKIIDVVYRDKAIEKMKLQ